MSSERLDAMDRDARARSLAVRGVFHPGAEDSAGGAGTVVLLGPDEPRFWDHFTRCPEYLDGMPDPLDRWSRRQVTALALEWGGEAVFPYDGPPYAPFIRWARASGRSFVAPVGLLVHDEAGLFISYRGAVLLPGRLVLPPASDPPCEDCAGRPCETACPVGALAPGRDYDVPACRAHVTSDAGRDCRERGCLVRRACPVSERFGRPEAQSAFHMAAFVGV